MYHAVCVHLYVCMYVYIYIYIYIYANMCDRGREAPQPPGRARAFVQPSRVLLGFKQQLVAVAVVVVVVVVVLAAVAE